MIDLTVNTPEGARDLTVREMPDEVFDWQCKARLESLAVLAKGGMFGGFGPHLPVLSVRNAEGDFPVNSAAKGVGLVPKAEFLEHYIKRFSGLVEESVDIGWKDSLKARLQALIDLYNHPDHLDRSVFGSLELYAKRSYQGVLLDPRASLLFVDIDAGNLSYEIHVVAELHPPESAIHRFETSVHDLFHVPQGRKKVYPFAYLFRVVEVYDKTPGPRASSRLI